MNTPLFSGMGEDTAIGAAAGGILGIGTIVLIACIRYVLQVIAY